MPWLSGTAQWIFKDFSTPVPPENPNHGIGGNHLLTDGLGPNALARVDRDILAQPGVGYVMFSRESTISANSRAKENDRRRNMTR
jgi:hypothetical protein